MERAAKGMIFRDGKVLVVLRASYDDEGRYDLPGGRALPGESLEDCLRREVLEETGIELLSLKMVRRWAHKENGTKIEGATYLCDGKKGDVRLSSEHQACQWLTPDEIAEGDYPAWLKEDLKAALRQAVT